MYEGTLPQTGAGLGVGGSMLGLSWLIVAGLALIAVGVAVTWLTGARRAR